MDLQQLLDAQRAKFARTAPPERVALFDAKVQELRDTFRTEGVAKKGAMAPTFTLPDAQGRMVSLNDALREGPVIVSFYRGGWCPYCNIELRAWQALLPEIGDLGAGLMAISPQLPDASLSTAEKNALDYDVLSDVGNEVARAYGLVFALPEELRAAMRAGGRELSTFNGDDSWELPVPGTFVIASDGTIAYAAAELDYRDRPAPAEVLAVLKSLASGRDAA